MRAVSVWKKRVWIVIAGGIIGLGGWSRDIRSAEAKTREADTQEADAGTPYAAILDSLTEQQSYACLERGEGEPPILLVTEGTYRDKDRDASMFCRVFYLWDGEVHDFGYITGFATSCPVSYDGEAIYTGGFHYASRYVLDDERKELVNTEYVKEMFDENGDPVYTCGDEKSCLPGTEESYRELLERYDKAETVDFIKK